MKYLILALLILPVSAQSQTLLTHPASNRAIAVDSLTMRAEPFSLQSEGIGQGSQTRVLLFGENIAPTATATINGIPAEVDSVNPIVGALSSIRVKLPDNLPSGDASFAVISNGTETNTVVVRIGTTPSNFPRTELRDADLSNNLLPSSALNRAVFQTSAEFVQVEVSSSINGAFGPYVQIGVRVNGSDYVALNLPSTGLGSASTWLPAGDKRVEIVSGVQYDPGNGILGVYLKVASFDKPATLIPPAQTDVIIYGDSIASGFGATIVPLEAWPALLRNQREVSIDAVGARKFSQEARTSEMRVALVARLVSQNPNVLWLAIGTNDWGFETWTASQFGAAYADVIDKLHAARPALKIYCQTPLLRRDEPANGLGSTVEDFRAAIASGCASGTVVDGKQILTLSDMGADGLHPSTAGHRKYAEFVRPFLQP